MSTIRKYIVKQLQTEKQFLEQELHLCTRCVIGKQHLKKPRMIQKTASENDIKLIPVNNPNVPPKKKICSLMMAVQ